MANLVDVPLLKKALADAPETVFRMPSIAGLSKAVDTAFKNDGGFDIEAFRRAGGDLIPLDVAAIKRQFSGVLRQAEVDDIAIFTQSTAAVVKRGGLKSALKAVETSETPAELVRYGKLADRTGDRTSAVIRLLGKGAIHLGKLAYWAIAGLLAIAVWLISAIWTVVSFTGGIRTILK